MQDLPQYLHPYWRLHDGLTILDGIVMKGSRVVILKSRRPGTLSCLHDANQGLTSTLQCARGTEYQSKIQHDISDMTQKCSSCQRHANKNPDLQNSRSQ